MKKLNNKGFSLVELIIVIAIMVILVVVIAPQYTKFVHNSKIAADVQTAQAMATALDVAVADAKNPFGSTTDNSTYANGFAEVNLNNTISKLVGAAKTGETNVWTIKGSDVKGVQSITLLYNTKTYQVYPNPDSTDATTPGINTLKK